MINQNFVIVGFIVQCIGGWSYLVDTVKGKIQPNRVSFLFWALAPLVAFAAEIQQGVGIASLMTFSVGFIPLCIFVATFVNKKAYWKLATFDYICGALSLFGLFFWYITKNGDIAIFFSIFADGLASIPTVVKSYTTPQSESAAPYLAGVFNGVITLLTIHVWSFALWAFPAYIVFIDLLLYILIKFRLGRNTSV